MKGSIPWIQSQSEIHSNPLGVMLILNRTFAVFSFTTLRKRKIVFYLYIFNKYVIKSLLIYFMEPPWSSG